MSVAEMKRLMHEKIDALQEASEIENCFRSLFHEENEEKYIDLQKLAPRIFEEDHELLKRLA